MPQFRVFDEETATRLLETISPAESIDLGNSGEFFSAVPGEVILAPSINAGDVLYIKIIKSVTDSTSAVTPPPHASVSSSPVSQPPSRHYVASGFLGLDGDLEEETPEPQKPWWKKLID